MCGFIAAFTESTTLEPAIRSAMARMERRGPDAEGFWQEEGVYLGHRRLAILDLNDRATQPMESACGRYNIVFNGEIYNFRELRDEAIRQGISFHTTSDTEVLLALFANDGEAMLEKLKGMFAFVIWDRVAKRAFAARDPYGIKPLYIGTTDDGVLLSSQVKALLATGLVSREPDLHGQAGFWMLGSVPEPHSWFRDIKALSAGHCAWIEDGAVTSSRCWYDLGTAWRNGNRGTRTGIDAASAVRGALRESVKRHLVSDVPVGVFLSGGIDSGALAGLMVEAGVRDLIGITIAYDEFAGHAEDETPGAAQIAAHYGIRHHVRRVTREEFLADLPRILAAMDQPSIDGVNTWYASKAAAELGLKVVVSGIGGDELFQGYSTFVVLPRLVAWWRRLSRIPGMRAFAQRATEMQAKRTQNLRWIHAPRWAQTIAGAWWLRRSLHVPSQLATKIDAASAESISRDFSPQTWVERMTGPLPRDPLLAVGQIESMTYLRNQLLRDSDWASMDHSVELRTPLVDVALLRDLQQWLPDFGGFAGKRLLAEAPEKTLPPSISRKRKTGFSIPVGNWVAASATGLAISTQSKWIHMIVQAYAETTQA